MWVLTIYDKNKDIKCRKGIRYSDHDYVEIIARNFVKKFKQYRKGWDWSILPLEYCKDIEINKLSIIKP